MAAPIVKLKAVGKNKVRRKAKGGKAGKLGGDGDGLALVKGGDGFPPAPPAGFGLGMAPEVGGALAHAVGVPPSYRP
eukprot:12416611-Karenia_brevis.AAC.1